MSEAEAPALGIHALAMLLAGASLQDGKKPHLLFSILQQFSETLNGGTENKLKSILSFLRVLHSFIQYTFVKTLVCAASLQELGDKRWRNLGSCLINTVKMQAYWLAWHGRAVSRMKKPAFC